MPKVQSNIRIYGDDLDAVWCGNKGVTLPTTLAAPGAGLTDVGWLGEDGIGHDQELTRNSFNAHQGGARVRSKTSAVNRSFTFQCLEEKLLTLQLYYPGLTVATTGVAPNQITTLSIPGGAKSNEKAWVVDTYDDTVQKRYVIPVGEIGETGTVSHTNSGLAIYEFTVEIMGAFSIITNNAAMTAPAT